jgi:hypothetical protein
VPDAGRPPVDAGPPRVVDGGLIGPFSTGELVISQAVRVVGIRSVFSTSLSARFFEVAAGTPSSCVERVEGGCTLRVCNLGTPNVGTPRSAGAIVLTGLLPLETDGGFDEVDAGAPDAGSVYTLLPNDAGIASSFVAQRLFFGGTEVVASAIGDTVPGFVSPVLTTPGQPTVTKPRCVPTCPSVPRDAPYEVSWGNVGDGDVVVQVSTAQVTAWCVAPASDGRLTIPATLMSELTPSTVPGDATLVVKARTSVRFDAGGFDVRFSAETPTLSSIDVLP